MSNGQYDLIIEPGRGIRHYWRDLWQYRELFYFLAWRDLLVLRPLDISASRPVQ